MDIISLFDTLLTSIFIAEQNFFENPGIFTKRLRFTRRNGRINEIKNVVF